MKGVRGTDLQEKVRGAGLHRMAGRHHITYLRVAESAGLKGARFRQYSEDHQHQESELDTEKDKLLTSPGGLGRASEGRGNTGNEPGDTCGGSWLQERRQVLCLIPLPSPGLLQASVCLPKPQSAHL